MLDLSGVGGLPYLVPLNPQVNIDPHWFIKQSQKYFADPLWFYHISTVEVEELPRAPARIRQTGMERN